MKKKIIYVKRFKEYSWKHEPKLPKNVKGGKELLVFRDKLYKFFYKKYSEFLYFEPDNGFFKADYDEDNVSLWVDFNYDLGAVISYFSEDEAFLLNWQDSSSQSLGWSEIELLGGSIRGYSFKDMVKQIQKDYEKYMKAYEKWMIDNDGDF